MTATEARAGREKLSKLLLCKMPRCATSVPAPHALSFLLFLVIAPGLQIYNRFRLRDLSKHASMAVAGLNAANASDEGLGGYVFTPVVILIISFINILLFWAVIRVLGPDLGYKVLFGVIAFFFLLMGLRGT
jgi:hypothetical protein